MISCKGLFYDRKQYNPTNNKLGTGTFGSALIVVGKNDNTEYVAKLITPKNGFDNEDQENFIHEVYELFQLQHPALVKIRGMNFQSFREPPIFQPTLLYDYYKNGNLNIGLDKCFKTLTSTQKHKMILAVADCLYYLRKNNIPHCDLRPENIVLDEDFIPHICDYGLAKCFPNVFYESVLSSVTGEMGTPSYFPPEYIASEKTTDETVDVYGFALIAYQILTNRKPYSELGLKQSPASIAMKIMAGHRPPKDDLITDKMYAFLDLCWSNQIDERPLFQDIVYILTNDFTFFSDEVDQDEILQFYQMLKENQTETPEEQQIEEEQVDEIPQNECENQQIEGGQVVDAPQNENETNNEVNPDGTEQV